MSHHKPSLLVVGGTGFIGSHLVSAACSSYAITSLSRRLPPIQDRLHNVNYVSADASNLTDLRKCFAHVSFDYVVNLAGAIDHSPFSSSGSHLIDNHFHSTLNLIAALDISSLRHFVQIGSSDEYGSSMAPQSESCRESPISPYAFAKTASTHLLQMLSISESLPVTILRLFLVYGPRQSPQRLIPHIISNCLADRSFPVSEGCQIRDFCFVSDVVAAILLTLRLSKPSGELINIASGVPVTIRSVIERVVNHIGLGQPVYGAIPYRPGENMRLFANIDKSLDILNWKPCVSLDDGLKMTINSFL